MLRLFIPPNATPERHYIADVLFKQFLGLDIEICPHQRREVVITDGSKRRLVLDDTFFEEWEGAIGPANKLPTLPLPTWEIASAGLEVPLARPMLPVIFGNPLSNGSFLQAHGKELRLGLDILGSAFFMLTRYEEVVNPTRDHYDRFPASASIAVKAGFLDRPIVNEYTEILWECMQRLWGGLERRRFDFRVLLSHDVDQPFLLFRSSVSKIARGMMGEVLRRNRPMAALKKPSQWLRANVFGPTCDPAYTFNYIMDLSERRNLRSAFYFIPSLSAGPPDYRYGILDPEIQKLLSDIDQRGHEIGYHASIETYKDNSLVQKEVALLRHACERAGSTQRISGSRQHYLRIEVPSTLAYLADARLDYDATLSFADQAGFRCGTCWEYEFFDVRSRKRLGIIERPLVVMECSVIDNEYMGLGLGQAALDVIIKLARVCRKFSGNFTLLWHNTRLVSFEERHFYEQVLESLATA